MQFLLHVNIKTFSFPRSNFKSFLNQSISEKKLYFLLLTISCLSLSSFSSKSKTNPTENLYSLLLPLFNHFYSNKKFELTAYEILRKSLFKKVIVQILIIKILKISSCLAIIRTNVISQNLFLQICHICNLRNY